MIPQKGLPPYFLPHIGVYVGACIAGSNGFIVSGKGIQFLFTDIYGKSITNL